MKERRNCLFRRQMDGRGEPSSSSVCRLEREKDLSFYIAILFEKNAKFLTYSTTRRSYVSTYYFIKTTSLRFLPRERVALNNVFFYPFMYWCS